MSTIYLLDINECACDLSSLEGEFNDEFKSVVNKYKIESDKNRSLIAWSLLKKSLREDYNIELNDCKLFFNNHGKPYLDRDIHFNITHSHNYIGIIISKFECGIDIEIVSSNRDCGKLIKKILSPSEMKKLENESEVIKYWTMKEAYYKRIGTGIMLGNIKEDVDYKNVKSISIKDSEDNDYYLSISCIVDDYKVKKIEKM